MRRKKQDRFYPEKYRGDTEIQNQFQDF